MSNKIETNYPFTGEVLKKYNLFTDKQVEDVLKTSNKTFLAWKRTSISERTDLLKKLVSILNKQKEVLANLITQEMGKPFKESVSEIEKCIWLGDFYIKNSEQFLADSIIETEAKESFISYDPLGTILGIMPWNYPLWQVMRFAIPTITAGNAVILKHANNVTGCSLKIQNIFEEAGYPDGCFQSVIASHNQINYMIGNDIIKAVSLTGSEKAGRKIAETTGKHLKKLVLELGGSNACIVLKDADLEKHIETMVTARMQNAGQSCIAAKRFIVEEEIYDKFLSRFKANIEKLKFGSPLEPETDIATMARVDLAEEVEQQISDSVKKGAKVLIGNKREKAYFEPTILTDVEPGMPVFDDEVFGPVASVIRANNEKHAVELATNSKYGLGTMIFTEKIEEAKRLIGEIQDGALFINEMVKSDPRLPFGGTKYSGYGRELSKEGILEFVNKKTVYIK
ncbi:NAD-dependent succinate-semialdehyde dehydrogenase [Aquimarina sp. AD1]|uniref:NAD-dependent succinate-semialdehyde dehydrogenase n=1 Tax=Aquimarina sp. (strain AD1) TaxID=1714848 RepID=UPI000E4C0B54|nr:NAD-dependent succinate-semialdehyde dehydrogenase [Aquimarina sp. AD1]AXT57156.1 NAD-dependent succinate-semialdehyde dehydrogenase [Aquimarina sp. AD1]RKN35856.1 aldehyde dehydrogenase family protein [Aquimarina sp. AD1]